mgnify:CR=1 FL=1
MYRTLIIHLSLVSFRKLDDVVSFLDLALRFGPFAQHSNSTNPSVSAIDIF